LAGDEWNSESLTAFWDLKNGSFEGLIKLLESERRVSRHIIELLKLAEEDPPKAGIALKRVSGERGRPKARPPISVDEEEARRRLYEEGFTDILERIGNRSLHITSTAGVFLFKDELTSEHKVSATEANAFLATLLDVSEKTLLNYVRQGKKFVEEIAAIADEKGWGHTLTKSGRESYKSRQRDTLLFERKTKAGKSRQMAVLKSDKE